MQTGPIGAAHRIARCLTRIVLVRPRSSSLHRQIATLNIAIAYCCYCWYKARPRCAWAGPLSSVWKAPLSTPRRNIQQWDIMQCILVPPDTDVGQDDIKSSSFASHLMRCYMSDWLTLHISRTPEGCRMFLKFFCFKKPF